MLLKNSKLSVDLWPAPVVTCVTAGAAVGAVVGAVLTGVVAGGALVPHGETPPLTPEATTALVEEPAVLRGVLNKYRTRTRVRAWSAGAGASP